MSEVIEPKTSAQKTELTPQDLSYWTVDNTQKIADLLKYKNSPEFQAELAILLQNRVFLLSFSRKINPTVVAKTFFSASSPLLIKKASAI